MAGLDPTVLTTSKDEYDVLGGYVPAFVQHLQDTRARLGIGVGPQVHENCGAADAQSPDWMPAELDALFRALSVYSRWRPDLIAACVPTRSEWEVWRYLAALEAGAAELAAQDEDETDAAMDVDEDSDASSDAGSGIDADEDVCEPAVEVSQAWIDVEEQMASWIAEEERCATDGDDAVANAEDAPPKRKRGRPRGAGRGRAQAVTEQDCFSSAEPSTRDDSREPSDDKQKRDALMGCLEIPHLLVLDSILRDGEEANKESREGSAAATQTEYGDEEEPYIRDVEEPGASTQIIAPRGTSDISNMMIDPVLLALSGDADPMERSENPTQGPSSLDDLPLLDAHLQPGATTMFTFPPTNTTHPLPDVATGAEPDLSLFSPRSRRRIQKRLYMRRKRANSEGVADSGIEKLRPGRKRKSEQMKTPAVPTTPLSGEEEEATERVRKKNKGGLTLPYKLRAHFAELGIDRAYLRNQNMDLLNLGALGRLMGSWSEEDAGQSIDADLIRHLQAAVVLFVTDITHRAIVWREREIRLKQRAQGWRQGDHITVAAIEHAMATVGARCHGHHFESLSHTRAPSLDGDSEVADPSSELPRLSPHRDVCTPLIRPPPEWQISPLSCLARTYEREATRTRRGPSAELEDELMSDETDEEALAAELAEDAVVDGRDMALSVAAEAELFGGVNK